MDQRHLLRKHALMYLNISDRRSGELLGHLGDVSDEGLMMLCDETRELEPIMEVRIELPDEPEFDRRHLEARIEIRWNKPDTNPRYRCVGCKVLEMSLEDHDLLFELAHLLTFEGIREPYTFTR